jgi:hypothetical protein
VKRGARFSLWLAGVEDGARSLKQVLQQSDKEHPIGAVHVGNSFSQLGGCCPGEGIGRFVLGLAFVGVGHAVGVDDLGFVHASTVTHGKAEVGGTLKRLVHFFKMDHKLASGESNWPEPLCHDVGDADRAGNLPFPVSVEGSQLCSQIVGNGVCLDALFDHWY